MKTKYITPRVTVVPFVVEQGFNATVGYSSAQHDDVMFHFMADDNTGSRFGNDQFSDISNGSDTYNFFGD